MTEVTHLNWIEIDTENLKWNFAEYKKTYKNLRISPVIKSNALGHGLVEIAKALKDEPNVPFLSVNSIIEAKSLIKSGIRNDILIIGYTPVLQIVKNEHKSIRFMITSTEQLEDLCSKIQKQVIIHLKVDTGMNRQGILPHQLEATLRLIRSTPLLEIEGICTHFADADNTDVRFTSQQIHAWHLVLDKLSTLNISIPYIHALATPSAPIDMKIQGNVLRLGIGLFGIDTSKAKMLNLKPVLSFKSRIAVIKAINSGDRVGYGDAYIAPRKQIIAVVPVGYSEGLDRRMSNNGVFLIHGKECPIIGRVSMNMTCIDISKIPDVALNEEVLVISSNNNNKNSIENISKSINTIPQEILAHLSDSVPRLLIP